MFYHSITEFVFSMNILGKRSDLPFSRKSDRKKEKSTVSFTHVQNIICSQTQLDGIERKPAALARPKIQLDRRLKLGRKETQITPYSRYPPSLPAL